MSLRDASSFRSRKQQGKEYIETSLAFSRLASERILAWSRSDDRGRLFAMKFRSRWQHPDCPVMKWYSQQCQSSTRFRSIEHCRSLDGPFYHEFLLLKLTDGAVCRVERIGDGSRTDAIRYVGCAAQDLIQWFSVADYESSSIKSSSERIAGVDLNREFDILDVLAVCYSIQRTKRCRAYTLQRYNCYFLCLTVLTVLTRRVASWETKIQANKWDSSLTAMYERWSNLSLDQAKEFEILAVCTYLEPANPRRAQFIFDILQKHLESQAEGFTQCNETMRATLWGADWESGLKTGLTESLAAVSDLFEDTGYCSQHLKAAVEASREDSRLAIASCETLLAKKYFKILAEENAEMIARRNERFKHLQRLWHIEHPVSLSMLAFSRTVGLLACAFFALAPPSICAKTSYDRRLYSQKLYRAAMLKQGQLVATGLVLDGLHESDAMEDLWHKAESLAKNKLVGSYIVRILDRLVSTGALSPSELSLVLADWLDQTQFAALLASLAAPGLTDMLSILTEAHEASIQLALGKLESDNISITISHFQETYLKHRIAAHAKRVARHQLAAERFVVEDIEEAMKKVWRRLPSGFGAVKLAPADAAVGAAGDA
ncbi:hypothetical protein FRC12_006344 [Ceratobasidium sp. 428]|nr:hypothetical protein FRC12_006344 [Ceratobasidium sp. 428]